MRNILLFFVLLFFKNQVTSQVLVSAVQIASKTTSQVSSVLGSSGGPYYPVKIYKVRYRTKDPFNNDTIASGAVFIPTNTCDSMPVVAYCHGTVLRKTEVPSAQYDSNYEGLFFASKGYVVAMPDYLGLGDNGGFHPYLHSLTEATATIDLMRAMREYMASTTEYLDGKVFVTGYSQGGHAAMATMKYIQDSSLTSEFNVVAGGPMSGPYSLSRVQPATIYDSVYGYNGFSPYVINSYQYVYGNLYTDINQYYDSPYNGSIPPFLDGTHTFTSLNSSLPTNIYSFMSDSVLDDFIADSISFSTTLRHDLKLNDNYSWNASMPIRACYCGSDDLVLPGNSIMAADSMTSMGSADVVAVKINQNGNHSTCFTPAITYVRNWFETFRTDCNNLNGITEIQHDGMMLMFPNPATDRIQIQGHHKIKGIEISDVNGKIVLSDCIINKDSFSIDISNLQNGFYIIKSIDQQGVICFNKFMVQNN